jgi:hypothetical protein
MKKTYYYFVSFNFVDTFGTQGYGSNCFSRTTPFMIKQTQEELKKKFNFKAVVINNFIQITKKQFDGEQA